MSNIIASQTLAAAGTATSSSTTWTNNDVIICSCINGPIPPDIPARVTLTGSIDGTHFETLESRTFGGAPNQTYYESFRLSDYLGCGQTATVLQQLNSATAATFSNFEISFTGGDTQSVTIAAVH